MFYKVNIIKSRNLVNNLIENLCIDLLLRIKKHLTSSLINFEFKLREKVMYIQLLCV